MAAAMSSSASATSTAARSSNSSSSSASSFFTDMLLPNEEEELDFGHDTDDNNDKDVNWDQLEPTSYAFYSAAFGMAIESAVYPLDVLKTRQQHDLRAVPRSVMSIFREVWAKEGMIGLFRGYLPNSLGSWPGQVVYYGGFEVSKHILTQLWLGSWPSSLKNQITDADVETGKPSRPQQQKPILSSLELAGISLTAGFIADITCMVIHSPADTVSQRLMVATYVREQDRPDMKRYLRMRDVIKDILKEEGVKGGFLMIHPQS